MKNSRKTTQKDVRFTNSQKRGVAFLLALLMALMMNGGALAQTFGVVYNTNSLNLRADGSSSSALLGSYPRGTWLEIMGTRNNFYQVLTPDGRTGFMSRNFINSNAESFAQIALVTNPNGGAFLNFRASPSYSAQVLGIFYNGVPLYVLSYQNGWYFVQINGQNGYVHSSYVSVSNQIGSSTVATIKTPNQTAINMRTGPGVHFPTLRQFSGDRYVMVLAKGNGWWRVSIDGHVGFMSSDFLVEGLRASRDITAENSGGGSGNITSLPYAVVRNPNSNQRLNLRMFPSTSSAVLAQLTNGTRLRVDAQGVEWSAVTVESTGASGYVMTNYLQLSNLPQTPTQRVSHSQGLRVNLRAAPSFDANVLLQVPNGQNVTVLIPGVEWTKVRYSGTTGYMVSYFLQ